MLDVGVHSIPAAEYHADPCPAPSLSSSIAKTLIAKSPLHAALAHPRISGFYQTAQRADFDFGTAAHALVLGSEDLARINVHDVPDWRGKRAELRNADYEAGLTPVRAEDWKRVEEMARSVREQLAAHECGWCFDDGEPEQTLVWRESDVWCRCRLDWLPSAALAGKRSVPFYDLKTTGGSASPSAFSRRIFDLRYDLQAAFYLRGIRAVLGLHEPVFRFIPVETSPPYALSVIEVMASSLAMADRLIDLAIAQWGRCLRENVWPAYPPRVAFVEAPPWAEKDRLTREESAESFDEIQAAIEWARPMEGV